MNKRIDEKLALDPKMIQTAKNGLLKFGTLSVPYLIRNLKIDFNTANNLLIFCEVPLRPCDLLLKNEEKIKKKILTQEEKLRNQFYKECPEGYEVDHILASSLGGEDYLYNLQWLPKRLNGRKNNMILPALCQFPHCIVNIVNLIEGPRIKFFSREVLNHIY
jgi:hypothetical protein